MGATKWPPIPPQHSERPGNPGRSSISRATLSRDYAPATRAGPRSRYSQLGELGVGGLAGLGVPAGHCVVSLTRRKELVGIDAGALDGAVADALVQPLGQHVVGGREALT